MVKFTGATKNRSFNEINLVQAQGLETHGIQTAGTSVRHEIFEGSSAIDAVNNPTLLTTMKTGNFTKPTMYDYGHLRASQIDSNYKLQNVQPNQFYLNVPPQPQPLELWFNSNQNSTNTSSGWVKIQ